MSLDVYLYDEKLTGDKGSGVFVRENGSTREITREEWDEKFPGYEPVATTADKNTSQLYWGNITHNLGKMAVEAKIYDCLWRPDEHGMTHARDIIKPLTKGLARLKKDPERFKVLNPLNGWGSYEGLVSFVDDYLKACIAHPDALIEVSR